ncbi:MAG: serine/threonine-protein kinase RsbW [Thermoleophilales bacterium]|jgi:anti-sigma regulatory factor (Ser/Thr protein kinase)|nr:serine/threonine-protein kinase RsbW [Thermoleophilales bacterium]
MATTYSLELPRTLEAPSQARDVLDQLDPKLPEHVLPDLRLLISELVSNGVKYGGDGPVRVEIVNEPDRVRAEIVDQGVGFTPVERDGDLSRVGGWGLHLVDRLTDRWGTYEGSTHVWFEIDPRKPRPHNRPAA